MKKVAIMLIMGGIFLIFSVDATAGITYPRNRVSIQDIRLNEHPWGDVYSRITTNYTTSVFQGKPNKDETDIKVAYFQIMRFQITYYSLNALINNLLDRFGNRNDQGSLLSIIR